MQLELCVLHSGDWYSIIPSRSEPSPDGLILREDEAGLNTKAGCTSILGFYGLGNFGDDLMGWMIAKQISKLGRSSVLFDLSDQHPSSLTCYDFTSNRIDSSPSLEKIIERSENVIFGGGGILVANAHKKLRRFSKYQHKMNLFLEAVQKNKIPLALLSVGGDGGESLDELSPMARRAISAATLITTRNTCDSRLLTHQRATSYCYPDIVWAAAHFLPEVCLSTKIDQLEYSQNRPMRIGVDLYLATLMGQGFYAAMELLLFLRTQMRKTRSIEWVVLNSKHVHGGTFSALKHLLSEKSCQYYQFHSFESDFQTLSSLDLLVSARLHVPIVALQLGVPTISAFSEGKTKVFFQSHGLSDYFFGPDRLRELQALLADPIALRRWLPSYRFPNVSNLQAGSWMHFQKMQEFLEGNTKLS